MLKNTIDFQEKTVHLTSKHFPEIVPKQEAGLAFWEFEIALLKGKAMIGLG